MVLAKRERLVLLITAAAVAVLALDRFALVPLLDRRAETEAARARLAAELQRDQALVSRHRQVAARWREMTRAGLKDDLADAESQVLHAVGNWAEESGASLSLLKPDRLAEKSRLPQISFQAAGTGTMNAVARLLWRIQAAAIPIRVTELQISARKEGKDDLSFQLRLSTVCAPGQRASAEPASAQPAMGPATRASTHPEGGRP